MNDVPSKLQVWLLVGLFDWVQPTTVLRLDMHKYTQHELLRERAGFMSTPVPASEQSTVL